MSVGSIDYNHPNASLEVHGIQLSLKDAYVSIMEKTNQIWKKEKDLKDASVTAIRQVTNFMNSHTKLAADTETMNSGYILLQNEVEGPTATLLQAMFDGMKKVTAEQLTMAENLKKGFIEPLTTFANYKFANVEYAKTQVKNSVASYEDHMEQFSKINVKKDAKLDPTKFITLEKELQQLKEVIDENTEEFIGSYKQFSHLKMKTLASCYANLAKELHAYHKNALETLDRFVPVVEQLEKEINDIEEPVLGARTIKEGILNIKRTRWNEEYCELRGGKFYCYKVDTEFSPENTLELQLCAVKSILPEKEREKLQKLSSCCFQVVTPGQAKPMIVQCASESDKKKWETAFLEGISQALDNGMDGKQNQNESGDPANENVVSILREVAGNDVCADCGAPDPVWASINLGVVVCLGCSGIHRNLGTHISKVRSLTLDHWDPELLMYMTQLGNTRANQFFECRSMSFDQSLRPSETSTTQDRKEWITMKYKDKKFIPPLPKGYSLHSTFYELVKWNKEMDVMRAVTLLFYGADTEQCDEFGITPLMQASIADNWLYTQALVLHGKNILAVDAQNWTALHHAAYQNNYRSLQVLTRGLKDFDLNTLTDYALDTPMSIATRFDYKESSIILNKESLLGNKVTGRLLELMDQENKFSLKNFQVITSVQVLHEDFREDVCEEEGESDPIEASIVEGESESDLVFVKNPWKRAADGTTATDVPKSQEKKGLLGLDLLRNKKEKDQKMSERMKSLKKTGKRAISRSDLKRRGSTANIEKDTHKRNMMTELANNLPQAPQYSDGVSDTDSDFITSGDESV